MPDMPSGAPAVMTTRSPVGDEAVFLRSADDVTEQAVRVVLFVDQDRNDTPREVHLAQSCRIGRATFRFRFLFGPRPAPPRSRLMTKMSVLANLEWSFLPLYVGKYCGPKSGGSSRALK